MSAMCGLQEDNEIKYSSVKQLEILLLEHQKYYQHYKLEKIIFHISAQITLAIKIQEYSEHESKLDLTDPDWL